MNIIIEEYYKKANMFPALLEIKTERLERNPDIQEELAFWIETGEYKSENCVEVAGFTAASIAERFEPLHGEGSFMLLIKLREEPEKAENLIKSKFHLK